MKAIRIKIKQDHANYRKEETIINKMTYPLPPVSTVIGALHAACGYTTYHPMEVSIQGKYGAMRKKMYIDHAFLNSTMNDRGILVKMRDEQKLSGAYDLVAQSITQGADFEEEVKINVCNRKLLSEYQDLRKKRRELDEKKKNIIQPKQKEYKAEIKELKNVLKNMDKKTDDYKLRKEELKHIQEELNMFQEEFQSEQDKCNNEYNKFASLVKSKKYYEILYDVELVLHIRTDERTHQDILDHIYDMQSLGRREDFVEVVEVEEVELQEHVEKEIENKEYAAYLNYDHIKNDAIYFFESDRAGGTGTKYFLNMDYVIKDKKRIFNKGMVCYISDYSIEEESEMGSNGLYYDGKYIVSFIRKCKEF